MTMASAATGACHQRSGRNSDSMARMATAARMKIGASFSGATDQTNSDGIVVRSATPTNAATRPKLDRTHLKSTTTAATKRTTDTICVAYGDGPKNTWSRASA